MNFSLQQILTELSYIKLFFQYLATFSPEKLLSYADPTEILI